MAKYRLLRERLLDEGVPGGRDELYVPDAIGWDDLRLVHDAAYVAAVETGTLTAEAQRRIGFPWSPMMAERARRSVGATLAAAREVTDGARAFHRSTGSERRQAIGSRVPAVAANLAGGTHHAFRDRGEGYCVFNDVAVAATVLLRDGAIARAAVIDCDAKNATAPPRSSATTRRCSPSRSTARRTTRSEGGRDPTSRSRTVPATRGISTRSTTIFLACAAGARPDRVFYLAGATRMKAIGSAG
jgi:hypothetical protein